MKLLAVDHNAVLREDRSVYRELVSRHMVNVSLLVPSHWIENYSKVFYEEEKGGLQVYSSKVFFPGKPHRVMYLALRSLMMQVGPDILYVNAEPENYLSAQAAFLRERLGLKTKIVITSYRNVDFPSGDFPYKLRAISAACERYVLNRVDHCIVKSQTAKDLYRQRGFLEATVIPPAVDVHRFKKAESSDFKRKLGLAGFTIGFVGRFVEEKGVRDLLHAANILNFPFQLLFVGRGPARKGWKELAGQLSIGDKIAWIDTVSHGEIERYLNCLDVLVLPSHSTKYWKEQFGRVLIEAMACGVPVIGSDSGEIPNVIGDAGLIFHEGDSDDLCRQLQRIHDDRQLREELVQRGLDRVRKRFSTEAVAEEYLRLFQLITSV